MYGLADLMTIPTRTTSKNIDKTYQMISKLDFALFVDHSEPLSTFK